MTHHRKHILSPALAVLALLIAAAAFLMYGTRAAAPRPRATNGGRGGDMFESLEKSAERSRAAEKVKKARPSPNVEEVNREYENSVTELADVLFNEFGTELPAAVTEKMKERLIRAELKYREGRARGARIQRRGGRQRPRG